MPLLLQQNAVKQLFDISLLFKRMYMKMWRSKIFIGFILMIASTVTAVAQCAICTKTAEQLGEGPAKGLNAGILYLDATPFLIIGYIGYRWFQSEKEKNKLDAQQSEQRQL